MVSYRVLAGFVALTLTGCGAAMPNSAVEISAPAGAGYAFQPSAASPSPTPLPPLDSPAALTATDLDAQRDSRPGLGTEWGERRQSRIRNVSFLRASPGEPFAFAQLYYNDRPGVEAQAAFHPGDAFHVVSIVGGAITVSLRDAWGSPLDALRVGSRTYVVGREGERYSILIANHTSRRVEVVATVDGLDVVNGSRGTVENRGYILSPWASLEIDGFRQSKDEVAAFRFAKVRDSYAARRGDDRNVGVIGVAFFAERGDRWSSGEVWRRETATPFPNDSRFAPPPQ